MSLAPQAEASGRNNVRSDVAALCSGGAAVAALALLASLLARSSTLPGAWGVASDTLGYVYTAAWSYSFYPQVILNWRRRSVVGLSIDFQLLNFLGFSCYSAYNVALFCVPAVRTAYRAAYSANVPVHAEDVAFAVHALVITAVTLWQCMAYDRGGRPFWSPVGTATAAAAAAVATSCAVVAVWGSPGAWLNLLFALSTVKLAVSLVKYLPQVVLNVRRHSTIGWSIQNVLLDFTGGMLSLAQLLLQCAVTRDWTQVAGNPVKFGLGFVSSFFDLVFMAQHYVLYPSAAAGDGDAAAQAPPADGAALLTAGDTAGEPSPPL